MPVPPDVLLFLSKSDCHNAGDRVTQLTGGDHRETGAPRDSDQHDRSTRVDAKRVAGTFDDPVVILRQPLRCRRRRRGVEVFYVVARVEADHWIAERGKMAIGVEILSMHAAITGGIDQQWTRRLCVTVLQVQTKRMAVQRDELIRHGRMRVRARRKHRA